MSDWWNSHVTYVIQLKIHIFRRGIIKLRYCVTLYLVILWFNIRRTISWENNYSRTHRLHVNPSKDFRIIEIWKRKSFFQFMQTNILPIFDLPAWRVVYLKLVCKYIIWMKVELGLEICQLLPIQKIKSLHFLLMINYLH